MQLMKGKRERGERERDHLQYASLSSFTLLAGNNYNKLANAPLLAYQVNQRKSTHERFSVGTQSSTTGTSSPKKLFIGSVRKWSAFHEFSRFKIPPVGTRPPGNVPVNRKAGTQN